MSSFEDKIMHDLYAHLVGRQMFCPITGKVLDVRTAVVVEEADGIKTVGIFSPEGWAKLKDIYLKRRPDLQIHIDGKLQDKEEQHDPEGTG